MQGQEAKVLKTDNLRGGTVGKGYREGRGERNGGKKGRKSKKKRSEGPVMDTFI